MRIRSARLLVIAILAVILLAAALFFAVGRRGGDESKNPHCVDLKCYDDSDCGSKCFCSRSTGATLGKCVAK